MSSAHLSAVADVLRQAETVVICGHVSPDGDCLGSQLALARALEQLDKKVTCLLAYKDAIDYGLRFLPGIDHMVPAADYKGQFDTFVTVDVPTAERMGEAAAALHARAKHSVTIDHHLSDAPLSHVNYIDASSPATACLIWRLIAELGVVPDKDMATCCYTGILTDTGRFQYQNTTAEVLQIAANVVSCGADPAEIAREVYQSRSRQSLALEQRMLANIELFGDDQFAISHLLRSDFVETGATKADAEPLIDALRSLRGIRVACMLRQQTGGVRGSLRAKDDTDVASIASRLGGGGHKAAAGFTYNGSIEETKAALKREIASL